MKKNNFPILKSPIKIGNKIAKNRIWMTAHATLLVKDHLFSEDHIAYYSLRAKGGAAVITMEAMASHPTTQPYKGKAFAFDPRMVSEYKKLSEAVHKYDTLLFSQPWHRGRQTNGVTNGLPVWAPSPIPCSVYREIPHEMSTIEIKEIINGYRLSAKYSREGGLDGIEVHGASHGYLLNQFLSPATNHRKDIYGGSFNNRMRIVKEILDVTRNEAGPDMIVGLRMNSDDGHEGGLSNNEWVEIAKEFERTGLIDYISLSHGTYLNRMLIYPTSPEKHGYQLDSSFKIKSEIKIPVVAVGRIVDPDEAEKYLKEDKCDFIGMARALIADPNWGNKAFQSDQNKIRKCVGANWCMTKIFAQAPIGCIHNPSAGNEIKLNEDEINKTKIIKKVAVIGGGPAGMRAAWTLSRRGHNVSLFEAQKFLGGQVFLWSKAESRIELLGIIDWLKDRVFENKINIFLSRKIKENELNEFDVLVFATGSKGLKHGWSMLHPEKWNDKVLPGADLPHVFSYSELFEKEPNINGNVLLYDTIGSRQGAVTAEYLAQRGANVKFVTQLGQVSPDLSSSRDWGKVHSLLKNMGVKFITDHELVKISNTSVLIKDIYTKDISKLIDITMVVLVLGGKANNELYNHYNEKKECYIIGDALSPRRVNDAISEGEVIARKI
ncbi:FAD-dependent oxidoreductase [Alphaproteobacteria bacterium]|nr:FAD-dependent oxidoreductase [Alphaproteobacteria bacterium]